MEVKTAVALAKNYVAELFGDEPITDIGLEEVDRDDGQAVWLITIGFNGMPSSVSALGALIAGKAGARVFRVVRLADDGRVLSVRRRDLTGD